MTLLWDFILADTQLSVVYLFIFGIVILTILAFITLIRMLWFYKQEQTQLNQLEAVLEDLEQKSFKSSIGTVDELKNQLRSKFQNSHTLVSERMELVLKLAKSGKLELIQAASETMTPKKFSRQQGYWANFVISVLLIIGLAGTLFAFGEILSNSGLSTSAIDYTKAIDKIYSGLESAMSASIAGILGTIILLLFKFIWVLPAQERFFAQLDWVTEFYLIPICSKFERKKVEDTLLDTVDLVTEIKNISENMKANSSALAEKLNAFVKNTGTVFREFARATNQKSDFYQASNKLSDAVKVMAEDYGKLNKSLGNLVNEHKESVEQHKTYVDKLENTQQSFTVSQEQLAASVNKIPKKFEELVDDYAGILQANKQYNDKLSTLTANLETQQAHYTSGINDAATSMTASINGVTEATRQLEAFTNAFNTQAESVISELTNIGINPLLTEYAAELKDSLARTQKDFMASIQQQQKAMLAELNKMDSVENISSLVEEIRELLKNRESSWFSFSKKGSS